jgi:hypothetical protein
MPFSHAQFFDVFLLAGHRYPAFPTFGAPCPTTIFTFGFLCLIELPFGRALLVAPVVWAAIGTVAAISLGVPQDFALPAAAAIALAAKVPPSISRARSASAASRQSAAAEGPRRSI